MRSGEQEVSPVSQSDAAERRGSVSADEQAQVAVWRPETDTNQQGNISIFHCRGFSKAFISL